MTNLLQETMEILKENNKTKDDVIWIGCKEYQIPIENFEKIANINYEDGIDGQEIAKDLIVVGKDFWLERREYDGDGGECEGSEWWEYKRLPQRPNTIKKIKTLKGKYCCETISEMNNVENERIGEKQC